MNFVSKILIFSTYLLIFPSVSMAQDFFALQLAQISADQAAKKALRNKRDKVLGVRKDKLEGRDIYVIKVFSPDKGRVRQQKIDIQSGKLLGK